MAACLGHHQEIARIIQAATNILAQECICFNLLRWTSAIEQKADQQLNNAVDATAEFHALRKLLDLLTTTQELQSDSVWIDAVLPSHLSRPIVDLQAARSLPARAMMQLIERVMDSRQAEHRGSRHERRVLDDHYRFLNSCASIEPWLTWSWLDSSLTGADTPSKNWDS